MCAWGLSEWGDIANIIIAVASVATAIVTAIVLCKQHKLHENSHQPIFRIEKVFKSSKIGKNADSEQIKLYNDGALVKYLSVPSIKTIFRISLNGKKQRYFEVKEYYSYGSFKTNNDNGIFAGYTPQNLSRYQKIYYELKGRNKKGRFSFEKIDLLKIEYIDINNVHHITYYKGNNPISNFEYKGLVRKIYNKDMYLSINNIQSQDLLEYF